MLASLVTCLEMAIDQLRERGLFRVDSLKRELELVFLGLLEEVSEVFSFLGECWAEVEGALETSVD